MVSYAAVYIMAVYANTHISVPQGIDRCYYILTDLSNNVLDLAIGCTSRIISINCQVFVAMCHNSLSNLSLELALQPGAKLQPAYLVGDCVRMQY